MLRTLKGYFLIERRDRNIFSKNYQVHAAVSFFSRNQDCDIAPEIIQNTIQVCFHYDFYLFWCFYTHFFGSAYSCLRSATTNNVKRGGRRRKIPWEIQTDSTKKVGVNAALRIQSMIYIRYDPLTFFGVLQRLKLRFWSELGKKGPSFKRGFPSMRYFFFSGLNFLQVELFRK